MFDIDKIVSCKNYAEIVKKELKGKIANFKGRQPALLILQVGDDQASNSYIKGKIKDCDEVGIKAIHIRMKEDVGNADIMRWIDRHKDSVDGIILQLPVPKHIDVELIQSAIPKNKDVDGFRSDSEFEHCTPKGILDWLDYNEYDLSDKDVVVVGRGETVGKPLAKMLIGKAATVISCSSRTFGIEELTSAADVVISAIGEPKELDFSYFEMADIIIDVGINRDENGKLCGDVDTYFFDKAGVRAYLTPVPNGVGLLTRVTLLKNVVESYEKTMMS